MDQRHQGSVIYTSLQKRKRAHYLIRFACLSSDPTKIKELVLENQQLVSSKALENLLMAK
jgi:hypothetical protein